MSKTHTIDIPAEIKSDRWHQYDRHQKAWLVWGCKDCEKDTDLHRLAEVYFSNSKIGRETKPPILIWVDGRVRVQFVGTYESSSAALASVKGEAHG